MLTKLFDNTNPSSLANRFRRKRFKLFLDIIKDIPKPVNILDAGGTESFWKMMKLTDPGDVKVTIINIENAVTTLPNFSYIKADARSLTMFSNNQFDIVFSNSVIEHVGGYDDQQKMAQEIMRVGKRFFVQTPNYYFPFEPHFMFPLFQFFPSGIKIFLLTKFNMGWFKKCSTKDEAKSIIRSIKLLRRKDLKKLFPHSRIYNEYFFFLKKSFIIYGKTLKYLLILK